MIAGDLVDDLSHPDHLTLVVDDGHGEDAMGAVPGLPVDLLVETGVLHGVHCQVSEQRYVRVYIAKLANRDTLGCVLPS